MYFLSEATYSVKGVVVIQPFDVQSNALLLSYTYPCFVTLCYDDKSIC